MAAAAQTTVPWIEVIAQARLKRDIEYYIARVTLDVNTRKHKVCLTEAMDLRAAVITALTTTGLASECIQDGGGSYTRCSWASKHSRQVIHIRHAEMSVLLQAMAAVERAVADRKQGFWSGVSIEFSIDTPQPVYRNSVVLNDVALPAAVEDARTQAKLLAEQAGLEITGLLFLTQINRASSTPHREGNTSCDALGFDSDETDDVFFDDASLASPRSDAGHHTYRVRFSVRPQPSETGN